MQKYLREKGHGKSCMKECQRGFRRKLVVNQKIGNTLKDLVL